MIKAIYGFHRWIDAGLPDCSLIVIRPTDRPILAVRVAKRHWELTYDYENIGVITACGKHIRLSIMYRDGPVMTKTTTDYDSVYIDMVNY